MAPAIKTAIKLILACFCLGLVFTALGLNAGKVLSAMSNAMHYVVDLVTENWSYTFEVFLTGAVVVLPIALFRYGLKVLKRRRGPAPTEPGET